MILSNDWMIEKLFAGNPNHLTLFLHISKFINSFGHVTVKVTKSQVSFARKRQFAWIWLPREWDKRRPPNSIVLSFSLRKKINDPQIVQVVEPYPDRWMHHVVIQRTADLNESVKEWLKAAYDFGS
jgi:hypothetical protein